MTKQRTNMTTTTIDVHTHFIPETYLKALADIGVSAKEVGFPLAPWDLQARLDLQDQNGIQAEVLSISSPGLRYWKGEQAVKLGRTLNEELANMVRDHPARFGGYATLPLPNVDASLKEIAYALDELKMDGVVLMTNYDGLYLGDPQFAPVLDELNGRKAVLFVHPTESPCNEKLNFGYPAPMVEYPAESTRMVVNLLDTDTITRCPDLRFIVSHGGGTLPLLITRIGELFSWKRHLDPVETKKKVEAQIASLYWDLAIVCYPAPLSAIKVSYPACKLMMGFDLPFYPADQIAVSKKNVEQFDGFTDAEKEMIDYGNAKQLFPRLAKAIGS